MTNNWNCRNIFKIVFNRNNTKRVQQGQKIMFFFKLKIRENVLFLNTMSTLDNSVKHIKMIKHTFS